MSILSDDIERDLDQKIIHPWISMEDLAALRKDLLKTLKRIEGHDNAIKISFLPDNVYIYFYIVEIDQVFDCHWFFGSVWSQFDVDDIISYVINKINASIDTKDGRLGYGYITVLSEEHKQGGFYNRYDHIPLEPLMCPYTTEVD